MTRASRLSTVGNAVLDGNGLAVSDGRGVSVNVSVGVIAIVCASVDTTVFVTGAKDVLVGDSSTTVGGGGVTDVNVHANDVRIHRTEKTNFRLISEAYSPGRILYPNNSRVNKINIPVTKRGYCTLLVYANQVLSILSSALTTLFVLFLVHERFEKYDRSRLALRALNAPEKVQDFL